MSVPYRSRRVWIWSSSLCPPSSIRPSWPAYQPGLTFQALLLLSAAVRADSRSDCLHDPRGRCPARRQSGKIRKLHWPAIRLGTFSYEISPSLYQSIHLCVVRLTFAGEYFSSTRTNGATVSFIGTVRLRRMAWALTSFP